jgi:hypothetical protein
VEKVGDGLQLNGESVYGSKADSWRKMDALIKERVGWEVEGRIEKRRGQLSKMQLGDRAPEGDSRQYRVGNSVLVVDEGRDGNTLLTIYGCFSTEGAGTWRGGRTNWKNSIWFEVSDGRVADEFIGLIDSSAKGYEGGTVDNYKVIQQAMGGVFPPEAMKYTTSNMFHRQEVTETIDLRRK